jgi:ABC-type transport system substrate-binding protein
VRIVAIFGAAVAALLLSLAAASGGGATPAKEGGTFRVAVLIGFFDAIDPALVDSFFEVAPLSPACGTLMTYPSKPPPAGLRIAPELAEAQPVVSRDGRTYTFRIRKDARFSDGRRVTARAFARAIERLLDPEMSEPQTKGQIASDLGRLVVGGEDVLAGRAKTVTGVTAKGGTLRLRLTEREPELPELLTGVCAVSPTLPAEPEGAKPPLPSPGPYYITQYVPGERVVLDRNRFYGGPRQHHVGRFEIFLGTNEGVIVDEIANGNLDTGFVTVQVWAERAAALARRYGVNKSQFFVSPGVFLRMFVLNTSRPLFRNNPKLRQAVNFAVDRAALTRELGPLQATATDQYLRLRDERIYPLKGPDLAVARKLAKGRTRGGKAVLYTRSTPVDVAQAQILQRNLRRIGLEVEIVEFPSELIFEKLDTGRYEFDIGRVAWGNPNPSLLEIFDGRTIGRPGNLNWSYFDSREYNRLLDRASRLRGGERYRAYAELDVQISREEAPAIPYAHLNAVTFVSARTGCVVRNPFLDLTAVCLK